MFKDAIYEPLPEGAKPSGWLPAILFAILILIGSLLGAIVLGGILAVILVVIGAMASGVDLTTISEDNIPGIVVGMAIAGVVIGLFASMWLLSIWKIKSENRSLASAGFRGFFWGGTFWLWFFLGIIFAVAVSAVGIALGGDMTGMDMPEPDFGAVVGANLWITLGVLLFVVIIQAPAEEVMFRGWMLSAVTARSGLTVGIIVSSIAFMLFHGDRLVGGWTMLIYAFAAVGSLGVLLAAVAAFTRNVAAPAGMHSGYNFTLLSLMIVYMMASYPDSTFMEMFEEISAQMAMEMEFTPTLWVDIAWRAALPLGLSVWLLSKRRSG